MSDLGNANWSPTDASNNAAPPDGWPEGMNPSDVNNAARANMGAVKRWWQQVNAVVTSAGATTAFTVNYAVASAALYDGEVVVFIADRDCVASATINKNSLGAKAVVKFSAAAWSAVANGDWLAGQIVTVAYDLANTRWKLVGVSTSWTDFISTTTLTTRGDTYVRGATTVQRLPLGTVGQLLGSNGTDLAYVSLGYPGVRQTVSAGPVDTNGLPTFLPSTSVNLNLATQNVSASAPLVATAANGWSGASGQPVDSTGFSTANLTWSALSASRAAATPNYLYGTISAAGVITTASTIVAPVYQWGGTPSATSGQITFNIAEMKAYLGNGTTAPQTNLVVFGEAATDATTVISTVAYAYNGRYESAFTATLPASGTAVSANHNIGAAPRVFDWIIECTAADLGYSTGDELRSSSLLTNPNTTTRAIPVTVTTKTIGLIGIVSNVGAWLAINKTTGADGPLTAANWKYKFVSNRGW